MSRPDSKPPEARRCACRSWIVLDEEVNVDLTVAVVNHQISEPHKSWNYREWIERNSTDAEVPIARLVKVA
jgi:hypothetical protein